MPRFEPSILLSDCWGSVGDLTFYHVGGRCYYKRKSKGRFAGTPAQLEQLEVHRRALAAWRGLEHQVQLVWNELAEPVVSHKPPHDGNGRLSGQNLFVSAYHGFYTLGVEHVPTPRAFEPFPAFSLAFMDATAGSNGADLMLRFSSFFPDAEEAERYQVLAKIQLTKPGGGLKPGLMRNFLADEPCVRSEGTVVVKVPGFRECWGLDPDSSSFQVHCRYVLLDRQTGYRNNQRELSFGTSLQ